MSINNENRALAEPPHPGEYLKALVLDPLNLSISEAATAIGVDSDLLAAFVDGTTPITLDLAARLGCWVPIMSAQLWLEMQLVYDCAISLPELVGRVAPSIRPCSEKLAIDPQEWRPCPLCRSKR